MSELNFTCLFLCTCREMQSADSPAKPDKKPPIPHGDGRLSVRERQFQKSVPDTSALSARKTGSAPAFRCFS